MPQAISELWKDFTTAIETPKPCPCPPALHLLDDRGVQQEQQRHHQKHNHQGQQEQQEQQRQQQQRRPLQNSVAQATPQPHSDSSPSIPPLPPDDYQAKLLSQTAGFAAVCMMRLVVGMHHHPSMLAIPCPAQRAQHEEAALRCALELLLGADGVREGGDIIRIAGKHAANILPAAAVASARQ